MSPPNQIPFSKSAELDPRINIPRPIYDPSVTANLDALPLPEVLDVDYIRSLSASNPDPNLPVLGRQALIRDYPHLQFKDYQVKGPDGNIIAVVVLSPKHPSATTLPALYHIHGGGQIAGDHLSGLDIALRLLTNIECVVVSVDYRLAPETRAPGLALDCHAGLVWTSENASELGIDPAQIVVYGISGGGPMAAATCLIARDTKSPTIPIKAQMLLTPMLDDRCDTNSDKQFEYGTAWCGVTNRAAWDCVLGEDRGTDRVTPYQAPARATDLSNLPTTYLDAAECEVFRDPAVQYASTMWRCGSTCELHIWPGGYHGFDTLGDNKIPLVKIANLSKSSWLERIIGRPAKVPAEAV